jgi:hypothetical protein
MSEIKRDYVVGRGKPPVHNRFKKGQSGNLRGPRAEPCSLTLERVQYVRRARQSSRGQSIEIDLNTVMSALPFGGQG